MARIALIKCSLPPSFNLLVSPPLGIMYIASVLREQGHEVKILDSRFKPGRPEGFRDELKVFSPEIVGLSALTQESDSLHRFAGLAREIPGVKAIVAGGPHPSAYPEEVLSDPRVDWVVIGEGEETIRELVEVLMSGGEPDRIRGIARREGGRVVRNEPRPYIANLDQLPFPAWDLIPLPAYARVKRNGNLPKRRYMSLMTSRACPYDCIYCHKLFGRGFRPRSPESVIEEFERLYRDYGIREFEVIDDIFNLDLPRVEEIIRLIGERKLKIRLAFPNGLRGDRLNYNSLKMMKEAGTYFAALAVETASPRLQEVIGKKLDLERVRQAVEDCRKLGITTIGFFMLGFPTETLEEARKTVEWAWSSRLDFATFFMVVPYGGTPMGEKFNSNNYLSPRPFRFADLDFHQGFINLSEAPDAELFALQRKAYRRFYLSRAGSLFFRGAFLDVSFGDGLRHFTLRAWKRARGFH